MSPEIKSIVDGYVTLWRKLGYEQPLYPINLKPQNDYTPHIEFIDGKYKWYVTEYGACRDYRETSDAEQALEWFAVEVVCHIVNRVELLHINGEEAHRNWFKRTVDMLTTLNEQWGINRMIEMNKCMEVYKNSRHKKRPKL